MASGRPLNPSQQAIRMSRSPAVTQLGQHRVPELRALALGDPAAQRVLAALHVHPDDQVGALDRDRGLVPDLDADPVDVDDRVDLVDRPVAPDLDLVGDDLGDVRDQFPRRGHAIDFLEMGFDVAGRHAPGIAGQHQLVDLADPAGAFGHDLWLELAVAVARHPDGHRTVRGRHRLGRTAVAGIAATVPGGIVPLIAEMVGHLGLQRPIEDRLGHLIEQTVDPVDRGTRGLRISEQCIDCRRLERRSQPTRRRSVMHGIGLVLAHVGVLPDRHVDHSGRSWSTRGLHTPRDTPTQRRYDRATGGSYAWLVRSSAFINFFYFYCVDADFGPFFLKFSTYFPYTAKLYVNGHEWAKRQAARAGIGFTALDNGFAAVDDVAGLQAICDRLGPAHIEALLRKWLRILPNPFTNQDEAAGYRYELSMLQTEFSLTQMLDRPVSGRIFFERVLHDNLDIGRPDQVSLVFDRRVIGKGRHPTPGRFRTRVITEGVVPSLHIDYKHTKIKQYHKEGRALRTETTINDTRDFGLSKRLNDQNLTALRQIGFAANRRLLGVQHLSHDPIRGADAFTDLTAPIITEAGTRIPGLRFGDPRVHALLQALLVNRLLPNGFTNRDLRALVAPLLAPTTEDTTAGKMTYDLRRLRAHGLIVRVPHSRRYQLTDTGLQQALLFTHAHDHLLRTGLAEITDPRPPAPSRLRRAANAYQAAFHDLAHQAHLAA
jgi:hypothetical protein